MAVSNRRWFLASIVGASALLAASGLTRGAQADDASQLPKFSGSSSVTQAIDGSKGAVFELGSNTTMTFPKGLPVGPSRVITLKKASRRPNAGQIHKGFIPLGTALDLSLPIAAGDSAIVLTMAQKSEPRKKGHRLVLAMEITTLCTAKNKSTKGKNGLCSGWELIDADYQAATQRMVAKLESTGGMRMVFGLVPEE